MTTRVQVRIHSYEKDKASCVPNSEGKGHRGKGVRRRQHHPAGAETGARAAQKADKVGAKLVVAEVPTRYPYPLASLRTVIDLEGKAGPSISRASILLYGWDSASTEYPVGPFQVRV